MCLFILAPSAPTDLTVISVLPTKISIVWSSPQTPNGVVSMYSVSCGAHSSAVNTSMLRYNCEGLEPGTSHTITVRAFTGAGGSMVVNVTRTTPCEC